MPADGGTLLGLVPSVGSIDAEKEGRLAGWLEKEGINAGADVPVQ